MDDGGIRGCLDSLIPEAGFMRKSSREKKSPQSHIVLGLIQMSASPNPNVNLKKAVSRIEDVARKGAQMVCLQELFRTRYFCQSEEAENFKWAETIPGPTTEALSKLAKKKEIVGRNRR